MNDQNKLKKDDDQTFWLAEYQNFSGQFQKFLDLYIKTFIIYVGILGILLKFALDKDATPELRLALTIFGLLCSMIFFGCIIYAKIMTRQLRCKRRKALKELNQDTEDEFIAGH